ncbi:MAG: hypothetical protein MJ185_01165 [Treponema sp.]|nr:hypothetical protein [Treponema sp.]
MRKNLFCAALLLILTVFLSGCKRDKSLNIELDNSEPLALAVDIEWAVLSEPYVTFRDVQEWDGKESGHGKKGDVLQVKGYSYSSTNEKWVKFEKGYLPLKSVQIFTNKFQADKVGKGYTEE